MVKIALKEIGTGAEVMKPTPFSERPALNDTVSARDADYKIVGGGHWEQREQDDARPEMVLILVVRVTEAPAKRRGATAQKEEEITL